MNRGDMRTQVRDIIGEDSADFWSDAELNRYLNEAQYRFSGEMTWPWLITEGSASLTEQDLELPEGIDFTKAINLHVTTEGGSRMVQPRRVSAFKGFELRRRYNSDTTATYPSFFYVTSVVDGSGEGLFTTTIRFIPTPADTLEVEYQYYRVVEELTADADIADLPVEYHKALVHHAAGTAWLKELNGGPKAQEQFELYTAVLDQAKNEFFSDPNDQHTVMGFDEPQYTVPGGSGQSGDYWLSRIPETLGP